MRNAHGYAVIIEPGRPTIERDTVSCGHCQRIIFVKPGTVGTVYLLSGPDGVWREEPGAGCSICRRPVCLACHDKGTCTPWETVIEQLEGRPRSSRPFSLS